MALASFHIYTQKLGCFVQLDICSSEWKKEREERKERKKGQLEMRQKKDDLEVGRNELHGDLNLSCPVTHQSFHQR